MLNPKLYKALTVLYRDVRVKNEDQTADVERTVVQKADRSGKVRRYLQLRFVRGGRYGETYVFNCPFCGDTRGRFSVQYLFNSIDPETGQKITAGLHCFNEQMCHQDWENKRLLMEKLDLVMEYQLSQYKDVELEVNTSHAGTVIESEVAMPGLCEPLTNIPSNHAALSYLTDRGLDWRKVNDQFGVRFIVKPAKWSLLQGRLLIPFYRGGHLIGWSARATDGEDGGRKYVNSTGSLGGYLYGLRGAMSCPVAAVVEGPMDKWVLGKPGFSLLNKTLGFQKKERLAAALLPSKVKLLLALVDPNQSQKDQEQGNIHQMDAVIRDLVEISPVPVLPVWLPLWLDPGACHGFYLAAYLETYLKDKGYGELGRLLARDVRSSTTAA